jgi:hypothetical protein
MAGRAFALVTSACGSSAPAVNARAAPTEIEHAYNTLFNLANKSTAPSSRSLNGPTTSHRGSPHSTDTGSREDRLDAARRSLRTSALGERPAGQGNESTDLGADPLVVFTSRSGHRRDSDPQPVEYPPTGPARTWSGRFHEHPRRGVHERTARVFTKPRQERSRRGFVLSGGRHGRGMAGPLRNGPL